MADEHEKDSESIGWSTSVGVKPHKVTVFERLAPGRPATLYLRWRVNGNWKKESLGKPLARTRRGNVDKEAEAWAIAQAVAMNVRLVAGPGAAPVPVKKAALALGATWDVLTHPQTGRYPTDTLHRRDVKRELDRAVLHLGADTTWESLTRADVRKLWRIRIAELRADGKVGLRGAETAVARILAIVAWLRDEQRISQDACTVSRRWKHEMRTDWLEATGERALAQPKRPRFTLDEMRAIIEKSTLVDPRLHLALVLGAELRLGQVVRCRRTDLDLDAGTFTVHGRGKKGGAVVHLTDGQLGVVTAALTTGFLRELEQNRLLAHSDSRMLAVVRGRNVAIDYPLFPAGQLTGGRLMEDPRATVAHHLDAPTIDRSVLDGWFNEAEALAEIAHVPGRGAYGIKRRSVDHALAQNISRHGLKHLGGWSDTQVPDGIYADQESDYAREEARRIRAVIRGEQEAI